LFKVLSIALFVVLLGYREEITCVGPAAILGQPTKPKAMLTANEIKTRGVKAIADALEKRDRVPITVRGKVKYVVMQVEDYDEMRIRELELAYAEVMNDVKNGDYTTSVEEHLAQIDVELKEDTNA